MDSSRLSQLEKQYGLPMGLLSAVMQAESGGNPNAVSPKGAQGLFQFMPKTAEAYGVNPFDPESSAVGAARMYGDLNKQYAGDVPSMLAAYNWGSGNLSKFGMEKAPKETRDYITKVQNALPKQYADSGEIAVDAQIDAPMDGLPEGFVLDEQVEASNAGLPEGFVIDGAETVQPKKSPLAGYGKALASGVQRGVAAAPMVLPNLINQAAAGPQMLYRGIRDTFQGNPTDNSPLYQPFYSSEDVLQMLPEKLRPHNPENAGEVGLDLAGQLFGNVVGGKAIQQTPKVVEGAKTVAKGMNSRTPEQLDEAANTIRESSTKAFKEMRDAGAVINRQSAAKTVNKIGKSISQDSKLNSELHKETLSVFKDFVEAAKKGEMGIEDLHQWRQLFGQVAGKTSEGKVTPDAMKAGKAIDAIDDVLNNLRGGDLVKGDLNAVKALKTGRAEWARMRKFEAISDIVKKADGDPNRLKNLLKSFADNKKKTRGFTSEELSLLKRASRNSTTEGMLKMLGRFGFDVGGSRAAGVTVSPVVGSVIGASAAGASGAAAAPLAGTLARQGQKYLGRGKVEDLLQFIEGGNPAPSALQSMAPTSPLALPMLNTPSALMDMRKPAYIEYGKSLEKFR